MATTSTISLKGDGIRKEGIASEAITPGHLVEFGGTKDYRKHATAAGNARKAFALENDLIGSDIDTAYALNDTVQVGLFHSGCEVYALVAAAASAITKGAALESAGNGTVRVQAANAATSQAQRDSVVGYALEAVDNSGGGSAVRIKIEVA